MTGITQYRENLSDDSLLSLLNTFSFDVSPLQLQQLITHITEVYRVNQAMNLTNIHLKDANVLHILDSLLFIKQSKGIKGTVLDIGSGAGFPGIPLSIITSQKTTLLEAQRKKAKFLEETIQKLNLSQEITVCNARAEEVRPEDKGAYRSVVARAVARISVLLEYAKPYLEENGILILGKGKLCEEELESGLLVAEYLGFDFLEKDTFTLPFDLGQREILVFQNTKHMPEFTPRRAGMPTKRPLEQLLLKKGKSSP